MNTVSVIYWKDSRKARLAIHLAEQLRGSPGFAALGPRQPSIHAAAGWQHGGDIRQIDLVSNVQQLSAPHSALIEPVLGPYDGGMATIPLTEAKAKLNELVEEALSTHERVTITRRGKPAVVLISVEDLESMEETLHWQSQPGVREDLQSSRAEAEAGQLMDEAAVRRRYGVGTAR